MSEQNAGNKPVARLRVGSVSASIWKNEGEKGAFFNATFQRSYKDKDGKWKNSESYSQGDLLELAKAADAAHTRILKLYSELPRASSEAMPDEEVPF